MWNRIVCNSIIQEKIKKKNDKRMCSNIKSTKSLIKIVQPYHPSFIDHKEKSKLIELQRKQQIDKGNMILISKLQAISSSQYSKGKKRKSLSKLFLNNMQPIKQQRRMTILQENQKFVKRITTMNSTLKSFGIKTEKSLQIPNRKTVTRLKTQKKADLNIFPDQNQNQSFIEQNIRSKTQLK